jgi:hypothetical protein
MENVVVLLLLVVVQAGRERGTRARFFILLLRLESDADPPLLCVWDVMERNKGVSAGGARTKWYRCCSWCWCCY